MSKTAEEILKEIYEASPMGHNDNYETWEEIEPTAKDFILQAMQTFAKQEAIRFHMFMVNRKGEHHEAAYNDIYQLFNQQNQK